MADHLEWLEEQYNKATEKAYVAIEEARVWNDALNLARVNFGMEPEEPEKQYDKTKKFVVDLFEKGSSVNGVWSVLLKTEGLEIPRSLTTLWTWHREWKRTNKRPGTLKKPKSPSKPDVQKVEKEPEPEPKGKPKRSKGNPAPLHFVEAKMVAIKCFEEGMAAKEAFEHVKKLDLPCPVSPASFYGWFHRWERDGGRAVEQAPTAEEKKEAPSVSTEVGPSALKIFIQCKRNGVEKIVKEECWKWQVRWRHGDVKEAGSYLRYCLYCNYWLKGADFDAVSSAVQVEPLDKA